MKKYFSLLTIVIFLLANFAAASAADNKGAKKPKPKPSAQSTQTNNNNGNNNDNGGGNSNGNCSG